MRHHRGRFYKLKVGGDVAADLDRLTRIAAVLDRYKNLKEIVWLQEEPLNMGAWEFARPLLEELAGERRALRYVGRTRSASPSEGSAAWHQLTQKALIEQVLSPADEPVGAPLVLSKRV